MTAPGHLESEQVAKQSLDLEVAVAVSGEFTSLQEALEVVGAEGFEGMGKALQILMNTAMHLERQKYLAAADYERTEARRGGYRTFNRYFPIFSRLPI